jgi:AcrR family transcriptional regulator
MDALPAKREPAPFSAVDEELRNATIQVLHERGFDGLTLERVAEVAGRARSTLWRQGLTRDILIGALVGELARDFRASMYPVLTSGGTGRERLLQGLEALCLLLDRHLPLVLATDEAFHQPPADEPHNYLHPFIRFLEEGAADGSLAPADDPVATANIAFNAVAWPYVHLRGRHGWAPEEARRRVIDVVMHGIAGPEPRPANAREKEAR